MTYSRTVLIVVAAAALVGGPDIHALPANNAGGLDAAPASRAPRPWRDDQVQKRSAASPPKIGDPARLEHAQRIIMAGTADGDPPDTPVERVDHNSLSSRWAGVCSINITTPYGSGWCSATPISPRHVLTAGHCFDWTDNGQNDATEVMVIFNASGSDSHVVSAEGITAVHMHPDYTGFSNPAVNDDLAIITLAESLPAGIAIYPLFRDEVADAERVTFVGYGESGQGNVGVTVDANPSIKRTGANAADLYFNDDETGAMLEVWEGDFDGPTATTNCLGDVTLGNHVETSAAPGDSGGPVFVLVDGQPTVWGTSTFISSCWASATTFGGSTGGMVISAYLAWIDSIIECAGDCNDCNGNGVADGIELELGTATDENGDGVIDECNVMVPGDLWIGRFDGGVGYSLAVGAVVATSGDPGDFDHLRAMHYGPDGQLYTVARADVDPPGIFRIDSATGDVIDQFIGAEDGVDNPSDFLWGPDGLVYVLNSVGTGFATPDFITRHDSVTGDLVDVFVVDDPLTPEPEHGGLTNGRDMVFGPDGNLYVADMYETGVLRFDGSTGAFIDLFATGGDQFGGNARVAFRDGLLYVLRLGLGDLLRFDAATGALIDVFIDFTIPGEPFPPNALDFDWGPDGLIYGLLINTQQRIQRHDAETGAFVDVLIDGDAIEGPWGMTFVPEDGPANPADVNGDGVVDVDDLVAVVLDWGPCDAPPNPCPADINGSGEVDIDDVVLLVLAWTVEP